MEYKWTISAMDCAVNEDGLNNVVKTIHWRYNAIEGGITVDTYGAQSVESPDPESFTDYDGLTESDVVGWLEASMDVEAMQENLTNRIELLKNPISVTLPPPFIK